MPHPIAMWWAWYSGAMIDGAGDRKQMPDDKEAGL
ncbi:MAG: hypothetical protein K0S45_2661 [Nitrospira sp.]|jgi:hypothetical protein|nr:hypothetical protein [Nitrospira sp.]